jgi:hypothetical protein
MNLKSFYINSPGSFTETFHLLKALEASKKLSTIHKILMTSFKACKYNEITKQKLLSKLFTASFL